MHHRKFVLWEKVEDKRNGEQVKIEGVGTVFNIIGEGKYLVSKGGRWWDREVVSEKDLSKLGSKF